jgi:hypothetical protein
MGRRASRWAHSRRNVWDMGPLVLAGLERHARTSRPLRRRSAVWAPKGGPAAFRYYAQDLTRALRQAHRYEVPPRAWRSQSLHVEHAPGLFEDAVLSDEVSAAQAADVGVVVSEHVVGATAAAWEQRADVLVALDESSATRLRERWPAKRVELIPPGCPAWRPPSRDRSGRVVAMIGRPSRAERADLASLRELASNLSGVEELRQLELPSSSDQLVASVNRLADVVVVWRGGTNDGTGMYLARVAVASGVPVVMSRVAATDGLEEVTLRRDDVAQAVLESLDRRGERTATAVAAREICAAWDWPRVAAVHDALWRTVST